MNKLQKRQMKLEKQLLQQLDEAGLSGKLYGCQEPVIKLSKAKGRKVTINAYTLISSIIEAIKERKADRIVIPLGTEKELMIDLITREALYFNDRTAEESYLDNIEFYQEVKE